jgi:hypothetical protein
MRRKISAIAMLGTVLCGMPCVFAQGTECSQVEFSQRVLDRFPRVREACLDVITRDGQPYAVFKADLVRASRDGVNVRIKLPDGSHSETRFIKTDPNLRVLVDGEKVPVQELALGQELTTYIKVSEPMIALAPETETAPLALSPLESADTRMAAADTAEASPAMPETASNLPAIGASGLALLALGILLAVYRRMTLNGRQR